MKEEKNSETITNSKTRYLIDVIIPTYDNLAQLQQTISSLSITTDGELRFIIVNNNNTIPIEMHLPKSDNIIIINPGKNLGWTGGLKRGLEESSSEFVMFANDDIFVPLSGYRWINKALKMMRTTLEIGALGPSSNCVMGPQNIWFHGIPGMHNEVVFLIGFCVIIRREALDKAGGVNEEWETGDDIDLSIRLRDAGYGLILDRSAFVYHHGFQTGEKIYGGPESPGGWNSKEMTDSTNMNLIKAHGFEKWWGTMSGKWDTRLSSIWYTCQDEGAIIMKGVNIPNSSRVLDLGCGDNLTVEGSIGLDRKVDANIDFNVGIPIEDESFDLVIARHIIEHLIDPIFFMEEVKRVLTKGGMIVMSTPDEEKVDGLTLDPTHVHVFTMASLKRVVEAAGLVVVESGVGLPTMSFYIKARKKEN